MPGDVPLGGPGRAGPSPVFGATFDRRPPPSGTRAGGPGRLGDAARGRVRARRPRPVSAPSQPRLAAVPHGSWAYNYSRMLYQHMLALPKIGIAHLIM